MDLPPKESPLRPGVRLCAPDLETAKSFHYEICTDDHADRYDHRRRYIAHVIDIDPSGAGYTISFPRLVRRTYFRRHRGKQTT